MAKVPNRELPCLPLVAHVRIERGVQTVEGLHDRAACVRRRSQRAAAQSLEADFGDVDADGHKGEVAVPPAEGIEPLRLRPPPGDEVEAVEETQDAHATEVRRGVRALEADEVPVPAPPRGVPGVPGERLEDGHQHAIVHVVAVVKAHLGRAHEEVALAAEAVVLEPRPEEGDEAREAGRPGPVLSDDLALVCRHKAAVFLEVGEGLGKADLVAPNLWAEPAAGPSAVCSALRRALSLARRRLLHRSPLRFRRRALCFFPRAPLRSGWIVARGRWRRRRRPGCEGGGCCAENGASRGTPGILLCPVPAFLSSLHACHLPCPTPSCFRRSRALLVILLLALRVLLLLVLLNEVEIIGTQ
mmetsp:Transcript_27853/g.81867  ORF Transcript_27853/g.81867 Transcript_27853/m.81867 type:complete len:358 (-) Transcript_27853:759-1832(-)